MSETQNNNGAQVQNAVQPQANNNAILSVVLSLFFAQIGGAICWHMFGNRSVAYCVVWFLVYTILEAIAGALIFLVVGVVLLPIIWLVIVLHTYKVATHPRVVLNPAQVQNQ